MLGLQFITYQTGRYFYFESACMALEGGCKQIRLRMKEVSPEEVETVARQLKPLCKTHGVVLIFDGHAEFTQGLEVDGVHLGKRGTPVSGAREILGKTFIIGGTANTFEGMRVHLSTGADYLDIGPFRFIITRKNLGPILGLEGHTSILSQVDEYGIRIPAVVIGDTVAEDIPAIMKAGVNDIILPGAILQAPNPVEETRRVLNIQENKLNSP